MHAVKLLEAAPHKEGTWDAKLAAAVARRVISTEEQELYNNIRMADDFDPLAAPSAQEMLLPVLPKAHRLHELKVALPDDPTGRLVLRCNRRGETGLWEVIVWVYDLPSELWSNLSRWTRC